LHPICQINFVQRYFDAGREMRTKKNGWDGSNAVTGSGSSSVRQISLGQMTRSQGSLLDGYLPLLSRGLLKPVEPEIDRPNSFPENSHHSKSRNRTVFCLSSPT
jgi:hypothetical protein